MALDLEAIKAGAARGGDSWDGEKLALVAEVERLRSFLMAIYDHGMTTWADTSCGRGGAGGQAMTTTSHPEVIQHLVSAAHAGMTLTEAADQYEAWVPGTARLDQPARPARRAGPDGRPVALVLKADRG